MRKKFRRKDPVRTMQVKGHYVPLPDYAPYSPLEARAILGLSQKDMATLCGYHWVHWQRMETGRSPLDMKSLHYIAYVVLMQNETFRAKIRHQHLTLKRNLAKREKHEDLLR